MWPDRRFLDLVGLEHPIVQAPMVGPKAGLAATVSGAGGLGSLACAALNAEQVRSEVALIRQGTDRPFNLNFFCHAPAAPDPAREAAWRERLAPYYRELALDPAAPIAMANRAPFDEALCAVVEEVRPKVVSFHFGLPDDALLRRVRAAGCLVFSSATTVREARWLDERGVDAIIAQGADAGGHRGMFLAEALESQVGTVSLVPQVVDAVRVPVIAAGGIADARGVAAALVLGASAAQIGTAYLFCPEAGTSAVHLAALRAARDEDTALTNVFTGRPARGLLNRAMRELGPVSPEAPAFPTAAVALQPLRQRAEAQGVGDFSPLWSGQAASLARELGAADLTRQLAEEARGILNICR
ncbi:nitronate monooxygenase family protein [Methylobacterium sp. 77]|uniref:NAD(P)H-dependent flavin oxidoreductase n=1 Tax=Methylobacterium sp. 77 TaxID=1101192 RepID=UPI0003AAFAEA|nr:nitronate monooxygenase family protein [Methylobacterium sp. 77]